MDPQKKIEELRKKIDELDRKLIALLNERASLVKEIIRVKKENNIPLYDPRREEEIFENLRQANTGPLYHEDIKDIYEAILQKMKGLASEE